MWDIPLLSKQNAGIESKLLGPLPACTVQGPAEQVPMERTRESSRASQRRLRRSAVLEQAAFRMGNRQIPMEMGLSS